MRRSEHEIYFETRWCEDWSNDLPLPVAEYRFCSRRWRFDFAWPAQKVALEIHGASHSRGRHNRARGMVSDFEKHNRALAEGWRVFYLTDDMLYNVEYMSSYLIPHLRGALE